MTVCAASSLKCMSDLSEVTAVILAGGLGMRFRPVMADRAKALAPVRGRPFLAYLLEQLAAAKVAHVILCTGYMGDQVKREFGDTYKGLQLFYSHEMSPLGTGGALRLALPLLKSDPILVMNGDSYCTEDLTSFWKWHFERSAQVSILLARGADTMRFGKVEVGPEGLVSSFEEKGGIGPGWINAGIYIIPRFLVQTIPPGQMISLEREVFPTWIGGALYGYQSKAHFLDIGTPEAYAAAEQFFATNG